MKAQIAFKRVGFRLLWYLPYRIKRQLFIWWLKIACMSDASNEGECWPVGWEEIYGVASYIHTLHGFRYVWIAPRFKGLKVLDLACGMGYGSYHLSLFAESVVGLDKSVEAIQWAKQHFKRPNLKFAVGDALNLQYDSHSFDVVVCAELLEHLTKEQQPKLIQQFNHLKPKILYMTTPNAEPNSYRILELKQAKRLNKDPHHVKELTKTELKLLLDNYRCKCKIVGQGLKNIDSYPDWLKKCRSTVEMGDFEIREFDYACSNMFVICKDDKNGHN